jgi:predicted phage gp36 major capsid-like protein
MTNTTSLETKGAGGETARAFEEFLEAFEAFKETNDQRLNDIEQRGATDTLVAEKLARIEETLDSTKRVADNLALKSARPHLAGGASSSSDLAHKSAFD